MTHVRTINGNHQLKIDRDYTSYMSYYDDLWTEKIGSRIPRNSLLDGLFIDFLVDLRGGVHVATAQAKMVIGIKGYQEGFLNQRSSMNLICQSMGNIVTRVAVELGIDSQKERLLYNKLVEVGARIQETSKPTQDPELLEKLWGHFLNQTSFVHGLWSSQRIAYVSICNAYENFVISSIKEVAGIDSLRTNDECFKDKFIEVYNIDSYDSCWNNGAMSKIRNIRHALSHAGGRVTKQTKNLGPDYDVTDGTIHIVPHNISEEIKILEGAIERLVDKCLKTPKLLTVHQ
jgi:hypothetical protein